MLKINDKTFMNLQEAVQWLLENNALPFQSSANYVANTEIGLGTIVNPSPAKVRIGSLIFFADSKVSTVTGLTENGFIVSDQYNDLVDDVVYVSNVALNASGHLIVTLSNGTNIDAGLIKQVSNFSIDGSQHLIANYNDGTSTDLGAIFNGDITLGGSITAVNVTATGNANIVGDLTVDDITALGTIDGAKVTGNEIVEKMGADYFFTDIAVSNATKENIYAGACKNGNKLTLVYAFNITPSSALTSASVCQFAVPTAVYNKIYPVNIDGVDVVARSDVKAITTYLDPGVTVKFFVTKGSGYLFFACDFSDLVVSSKYYMRLEITLLLSPNLAS